MDISSSRNEVRTAMVTGASSGLGVAMAVALGELGFRVAVGARREDRLQETAKQVEAAGGECLAHALDVSKPESIETFFAAMEERFGVADIVVNNAGLSHPAPVHELELDRVRQELDVNLLGAVMISRRFLKPLLKSGQRGDLVFITSDAARFPRPHQSIYTATKAALEAFSSALALELEGTGIRSTVVRPGPAISEYAAGWDPAKIVSLLRRWQHYGLQRNSGVMPSEAVAQAVIAAITTPPGVRLDLIEVQPEATHGPPQD
ncbi:MAG: SDR family NAD(P)-dependent oxidoreductase [Myxococcota bacterium]|nr:SDR family NAD(P)-dependent oxidoreductase [Myxococcota bacterium]